VSIPGVPGFRPRFFIHGPAGSGLEGIELALSPEDSYHALRVLRLGEGDACEVVVGAAVYAAAVVAAADPVMVRLFSRLEGAEAGAEYRLQVGVVQALARPAVMDHVFEKGTEVGASFFVLIRAAGSPKGLGPPGEQRMTRWRRIAKEAAKQSKQVAVPPVSFAGSVEEGVSSLEESSASSLVLEPAAPWTLKDTLETLPQPARLALWVGPESGWTSTELDCFRSAGIETARLGRSVLRTETAGPIAVAVARLALGDW